MTKEELVHITLKQLSESLKETPANFRFEDSTIGTPHGSSFHGPTIIWQFRVEIEDNQYIADPLNAVKTIIVTYNKMARQLQCYIYNREVNNLNHAMMADAQAVVVFHEWLHPMFYRTYRQFNELRSHLVRQVHEKEFMDYVRRLNGIFPGTHEDDIFK